MAIGVIRPPRRGSALAASYPLQSARPPAREWTQVRGPLYWRGKCDLAGGFPGFAQHGGFFAKAHVQVTASYLLVEEGRAGGFGLPLQTVTSAFVIDLHERGDSLVRLHYHDAELGRTFTVRFCGVRAALRPGHYARQLLRAIQATEMTQVLTSHALPEPELLVPWTAAHQFQHEPVHWHDRALAPIVLGESLRLSDVWLTDTSLIWGCGSGMGINRLPLGLMTDVIPAHVEDRAGTPAVYVSFADDAGRRHEVPFLFNRGASTAENEQHEIAMLNALRAHGIPLGAANGKLQPWRIDFPEPSPLVAQAIAPEPHPTLDHSEQEELRPLPLAVPPNHQSLPEVPVVNAQSLVAAEPVQQDKGIGAGDLAPTCGTEREVDEAMAALEIATASQVADTGTAATDQLSSPIVVIESASAPEVAHEVQHSSSLFEETDEASTGEGATAIGMFDVVSFPRFRQVEAKALANLAEILREIDDRLTGKPLNGSITSGPTPTEQSLAHHELADAAIAGHLTWEEVRLRRARLNAIVEATPRLQTLLELHGSGHLDDAVLQRKRLEVKDELSSLVMVH